VVVVVVVGSGKDVVVAVHTTENRTCARHYLHGSRMETLKHYCRSAGTNATVKSITNLQHA
jgi:hypothetical protein